MSAQDKVGPQETETAGLFGEPVTFDPEFTGSVRHRSCTDIFCLLLFLFFLAGWIVVGVLAALNGDPTRLMYPTDSRGQVCGRDQAVANKPYLFFFDMTKCASPKVPFTGCPTPQVCVKECPTESWFSTTSGDKSKLICKEDTDTSKPLVTLLLNNECAAYYIKSEPIGRRCIPRILRNYTGEILDTIIFQGNTLNSTEKFDIIARSIKYVARFARIQKVVEGVVEDIRVLWPHILLGCAVAMVVSLVWIVLLRVISTVMVWFSLLAFTALSACAAYYTMYKYLTLREAEETQVETMTEMVFAQEFNRVSELERTWLILFIVTIVIFIVCLIILIFLRKRIRIAIALINEASKAVADIMTTLVFPIVPFVLHLLFIFVFCVIAVLLASAGSPEYRVVCKEQCCTGVKENATCDPHTFTTDCNGDASCQFFDYTVNEHIPRLHFYNIFALLWTLFFTSAFSEMVLAGAFSTWYWTFKKDHLPSTPVASSLANTVKYHIGTLAFGSLVIAIVRSFRLVLEYIDQQIKKNSDSKIARAILCCCRCCLWCLEKFLKFVNRNAYIYCAIYGKNFCTSARNSFNLIMRNVVRVVILDKVTDFLLLIGKLVVTGGVGLLAFALFSDEFVTLRSHLPAMNYYLTPVLIITLATFFIASAFFSVYNMAVDTLFLCFLEDCERNDGSSDKPYFMSRDLMKILNKENKLKDKEVDDEHED